MSQREVVCVALLRGATAWSPAVFDTIIPIFSAVTLTPVHTMLFRGWGTLLSDEARTPSARRSCSELAGGMWEQL